MTDASEALQEMLKFMGALAVTSGLMAWWRKDSLDEDEMVADSCDLVIDTLSNADKVNIIDMSSGKNLREQLSVADLEELNREREMRRFNRRN